MTVVGAGYSFLDEVWKDHRVAPAPPKRVRGGSRSKTSVHCDLASQKATISRPYASPTKARWGMEDLHPDVKPSWEANDAYAPPPPISASDDDTFFDTALAQGLDSDHDGRHDYQAPTPPPRNPHRKPADNEKTVPADALCCDRVSAMLDEDRRTTLREILRSVRDARAAADSAVALIREDQREKSSRSKNLDLVAYILGGLFTILVLEQFVQLGRGVRDVLPQAP